MGGWNHNIEATVSLPQQIGRLHPQDLSQCMDHPQRGIALTSLDSTHIGDV